MRPSLPFSSRFLLSLSRVLIGVGVHLVLAQCVRACVGVPQCHRKGMSALRSQTRQWYDGDGPEFSRGQTRTNLRYLRDRASASTSVSAAGVRNAGDRKHVRERGIGGGRVDAARTGGALKPSQGIAVSVPASSGSFERYLTAQTSPSPFYTWLREGAAYARLCAHQGVGCWGNRVRTVGFGFSVQARV